jgi:hypothetical protein
LITAFLIVSRPIASAPIAAAPTARAPVARAPRPWVSVSEPSFALQDWSRRRI